MNNELEQLKIELNELKKWKQSLESSNMIPLEIDRSFRGRFKFSSLQTSSKSPTSENQAVNESGTASYSVLKAPNGFVQTTLGEQTIYLPSYTSL